MLTHGSALIAIRDVPAERLRYSVPHERATAPTARSTLPGRSAAGRCQLSGRTGEPRRTALPPGNNLVHLCQELRTASLLAVFVEACAHQGEASHLSLLAISHHDNDIIR